MWALIVLGCVVGTILSLALLYVIVVFVSAALVNPDKEYEKHSGYYRWLLNSATWFAVRGARIKLHANGVEKIPKGRFLVVGNHLSNWDPILTWSVMPGAKLSFISKEGNFHIPAFGRIIRRCCFKVIDRGDARESLKTLHRAAEMIRKDEVNYGIYPEGTRNREPEKGLLPFHNGVFKIAQQANVPIVVVAVRGTEKVAGNFPWHKTDVYLDICDVIPPEEHVKSRTQEIGARVEADLKAVL